MSPETAADAEATLLKLITGTGVAVGVVIQAVGVGGGGGAGCVGVAVGGMQVKVGVGVAIGGTQVNVGVKVLVGVFVGVNVLVGVFVGVKVLVGVLVNVKVLVGVFVGVGVGGTGVKVNVGVKVLVGVKVKVGVGGTGVKVNVGVFVGGGGGGGAGWVGVQPGGGGVQEFEQQVKRQVHVIPQQLILQGEHRHTRHLHMAHPQGVLGVGAIPQPGVGVGVGGGGGGKGGVGVGVIMHTVLVGVGVGDIMQTVLVGVAVGGGGGGRGMVGVRVGKMGVDVAEGGGVGVPWGGTGVLVGVMVSPPQLGPSLLLLKLSRSPAMLVACCPSAEEGSMDAQSLFKSACPWTRSFWTLEGAEAPLQTFSSAAIHWWARMYQAFPLGSVWRMYSQVMPHNWVSSPWGSCVQMGQGICWLAFCAYLLWVFQYPIVKVQLPDVVVLADGLPGRVGLLLY